MTLPISCTPPWNRRGTKGLVFLLSGPRQYRVGINRQAGYRNAQASIGLTGVFGDSKGWLHVSIASKVGCTSSRPLSAN